MNTDTGEIREMTAEEVAALNAEAGRELWVPLYCENWIPRTRRERKMSRVVALAAQRTKESALARA